MNHRVLLDLQATQSQAHADRGIARYVKEQVRALLRQGVGDALLLNPHLPFPRQLDGDLLASPLLQWATQREVRRIAEADESPIAYYLTSPFEVSLRGEGDLPPHLLRGDIPVATTLYDLIPLLMPERYLPDPILERRYRARVEQLHHVDLVLCISEHTRRDAIRLLGLDPAKVITIGFGVSSFFRPPVDGDPPPPVPGPYALAVLGGDPRKNAERLFEAWAAAGSPMRLVVTNGLDPQTRAAWEAAVAAAGLKLDDDVLLTGWLPDPVLRALYQRCELFVFPSLYEGAGLPAAEALACGAPVLTSSTSSLPEVLDLPEATFDPSSIDEMAAAMRRGLEDEDFRSRLRRRGRERIGGLSWDAVASRTVDALATLPASGPTRLPWRLALVGPFPPNQSGIADYNAQLLPALAKRAEIDVFTPTATPGSGDERVRWFPPRALKETCSPWAYDAVVYTAGNSDDHHDLYDLAQELPGILWLHDVRLQGLYLSFAEARLDEAARPVFLRDRLLRQYRRRLPLFLADDPEHPANVYIDHGLGLSKELVDVARRVVVSSELAARLLRLDQQPDARETPIEVIPLAVPPPWTSDVVREELSIVSLGMVSPVKGTDLLLATIAAVRAAGEDATLTFVGPVTDDYAEVVRAAAAAAGLADHVHLTGRLDDASYRTWLARATVAVQLRVSTNGESSAAITGALAAGLPVVTNAPTAAELPTGTVTMVPFDVDAAELATELVALLRDPARRRAQAAAGQSYAQAWTFEDVAERLFTIVRAGA